jgi:hypothetical protein
LGPPGSSGVGKLSLARTIFEISATTYVQGN